MNQRHLMVKQCVGKIKTDRGVFMQVFTTGDSRYLLFKPMDPTGTFSGTIDIPILKRNLKTVKQGGWKTKLVP